MRFVLKVIVGCTVFLVSCTSTGMNVLVHMIEEQENYFRREVVPPFEKTNAAELTVLHYDHTNDVDGELKKYADVGLVKIPFSEGYKLAQSGAMIPLDSILTSAQLRDYENTYLLTSLAKVNGRYFYVPRKFETRILVYRKSKVRQAYELWRKYRSSIHESLKAINGYGLPATFLLEQNPQEWDYYDIFVLGWIWANSDESGENRGRIAHRGKRYHGSALRIIDRIFQCGGDSAAVVSMRGDAVVDAMHWEAVYAAAGIYNPRMWERKWSGADIWQGFADGEVYLSFMTQLDCFYLHGTGRDGLDGYLPDPEDMGVSVMPQGCSVQLDEKGRLQRSGQNAITTGGWWWGIAAGTPDARKSYELARHITNTENQIQGCTRFGMIPVRKDILSDMPLLFGGSWIAEIYAVSFKQLMHNKRTTLPAHPDFEAVTEAYLDAWFQIVAEKDWSADGQVPDRAYIEQVLQKYTARVTPKKLEE